MSYSPGGGFPTAPRSFFRDPRTSFDIQMQPLNLPASAFAPDTIKIKRKRRIPFPIDKSPMGEMTEMKTIPKKIAIRRPKKVEEAKTKMIEVTLPSGKTKTMEVSTVKELRRNVAEKEAKAKENLERMKKNKK